MYPGRGGADGSSDAPQALERMRARDGAKIAASGRTILLAHPSRTPEAYVLFHGLTASPLQFLTFGRLLHEGGANVLIPRLPRHGHHDRLTDALAGLTADELAHSAREAVVAARGLGERVTVVGFSAGGLMSAWIAQHLAVDRSVSIAPFLGIAWWPSRLSPLLSTISLRLPNRFLWWNPLERERKRPTHGYPRYATHAVGNAWRFGLELLATARRAAPATNDIVLVSNASETTVNNRATERLAHIWRAYPGIRVETRRLTGLPRSHDIIEPLRPRPLADRVYPTLLEIVTELRSS
jgi:alpha-beta hydrolase superfamily lysophospholipase